MFSPDICANNGALMQINSNISPGKQKSLSSQHEITHLINSVGFNIYTRHQKFFFLMTLIYAWIYRFLAIFLYNTYIYYQKIERIFLFAFHDVRKCVVEINLCIIYFNDSLIDVKIINGNIGKSNPIHFLSVVYFFYSVSTYFC